MNMYIPFVCFYLAFWVIHEHQSKARMRLGTASNVHIGSFSFRRMKGAFFIFRVPKMSFFNYETPIKMAMRKLNSPSQQK
jgi:hypothetical protein